MAIAIRVPGSAHSVCADSTGLAVTDGGQEISLEAVTAFTWKIILGVAMNPRSVAGPSPVRPPDRRRVSRA
jgi:hypothetical protein